MLCKSDKPSIIIININIMLLTQELDTDQHLVYSRVYLERYYINHPKYDNVQLLIGSILP